MADLHINYRPTAQLRRLLRAWDEGIAAEGPVVRHRWTDLSIWPAARSATVAGSTGIEGNPLSAVEVDEVLSGGHVDASAEAIGEVRNYNSALDLANRAALRDDFEWSQELLRRINAEILDGLNDDDRGEYRAQPVTVGGTYAPPDHHAIPSLMTALTEWLRHDSGEHALVRAGLAHLNVVSIHPWLNGNGRAARVVGSLMLMRHGVAAPELVNVESYIRANRDEYIAILQETHGESYQPDRHTATAWLEYVARVSVDRLDLRNRIDAAVRNDIGRLVLDLSADGRPVEWAPVLLGARINPVRTARLAEQFDLSQPRVRAMLAQMVAAGWLEAVGERRGRRYVPSPRLTQLDLRTPALMEWLREGRDEEPGARQTPTAGRGR